MIVHPFSPEERLKHGFTHRVEVTWSDLVATAALTKAHQIFPETGATGAGIGTHIRKCAAKVVTAFAGCATLVVEIGDDGDVDRNLASFDMKSTAGTWKTLQPTTTTGNVFNTANAIDALFTATTDNLTQLTAGEVHIFLDVVNLNDQYTA